jgi:hypothetical protein
MNFVCSSGKTQTCRQLRTDVISRRDMVWFPGCALILGYGRATLTPPEISDLAVFQSPGVRMIPQAFA